MSIRVEVGGVLREFWDDSNRTYKTFNAAGAQTSTRPFTPQENVDADARIASDNAAVNQADGASKIETVDLPATQAIIADTNANINSNAAARIKDLATAVRRLEKQAIKKFDTP